MTDKINIPIVSNVSVPEWALHKAIQALDFTLTEIGGCDHNAGICICNERQALQILKLAHVDAIKDQERYNKAARWV